MKFYWSYTQFPELSGYDSREKRIIWLNLSQWKGQAERKSWAPFVPAIIIATFVLGMVVGAFKFRDPEYGCFFGGIIGSVAPAPFIWFIGINSRRNLLKRYLDSEDFSLVPVNEQVIALLNLFKWQPRRHLPVAASQPEALSNASGEMLMDLKGSDTMQPVLRFVNLVLHQAIFEKTEKIEFSLLDASSETGLRISYSAKRTSHEISPAPGRLFAPVVTVLCNYASTAYYAKGPIKSKIQTKRPNSCWLFESDDLKKHVLLSKA